MKNLGEKISILEKDNVVSVVIYSTDKKWKTNLMFIWLFLWTICGVVVFANYFNLTDKNQKMIVIIYMAFWAYFEFKIAKAFMFRKFGKEKIWIKKGVLYYQRQITSRSKINEYDVELINDFRILQPDRGNFFVQMQESFWVIGGEKLCFNYGKKQIVMGIQIADEHAKKLFKLLNKYISINPN